MIFNENDSIDSSFLITALEGLRDNELMNFSFYKPHKKQLLFHEAGLHAKERLFLAGNRTGKTFCCSIETVMHLTGVYLPWWNGERYNYPINVWVATISRELTRDVLQKQYYLGDESSGKIGLIHKNLIVSKTPGSGVAGFVDTVYIRHSSGGTSVLSFKSYDQGREKFQGTEKHFIHLDEECPDEVYTECLTRTMSTKPGFKGKIILSMTPLKGMTKMVLKFTDKQEDGVQKKRSNGVVDGSKFYVMADWNDNPYLSEEDKTIMRSSMLPHELEARERGVPSMGSGMVYPVIEDLITCDPFEIPNHWPRLFAMDFGWTDPTALLFFAHDKDNDIVYVYSEYKVSQRTPQEHCFQIKDRGIDWIPGKYDPAGRGKSQIDGQNLVALYRNSGMNLSKANNAIQEGIITVLQRMQNGKIFIFKNLNLLLSELRMYARDEKGNITGGNDHLLDCLRYGIMGINDALTKIEVQGINNLNKYYFNREEAVSRF